MTSEKQIIVMIWKFFLQSYCRKHVNENKIFIEIKHMVLVFLYEKHFKNISKKRIEVNNKWIKGIFVMCGECGLDKKKEWMDFALQTTWITEMIMLKNRANVFKEIPKDATFPLF